MKLICILFIFIGFIYANEFQSKHLNKKQIQFLKEHPTITVSNLKDWAPFDYYENDEAKGYSVEYIKLLADKIGVEVKFDTDTWSNIINKIKNKQIDLVHPLSINEDRKKYLEFTQTIFDNNRVIVTNDSNTNIKTLKDLEGKTLAVAKGWNPTQIIEKNYPKIKLKYYDGSLDMIKAVAFGEVDATIDNFLTINYLRQKHLLSNLEISGRVEIPTLDQRLYIGVRKDWKILSEIINIAINNISNEELVSLNTKWMIENKKRATFSNTELEFLKNKKELFICVAPDWLPYSKIENNTFKGMSSDYFEEFKKFIPLEMKLIPTKTWSQSLDFIKDRKCDLLALAAKTPSRKEYLNFTKPYLDLPYVIATKLDKPFISNIKDVLNYKLGIVKGTFYIEILKKRYPNIKIIELDNVQEGIDKVISGEIYGYIDALIVIGQQVQQNYFGELKISGKLDENQKIGIALRNDMPPLQTIFNKAIDNISEQKHREILNKWVSVKYENSFNYTYIWIVSSILIIIVAFIFYRQYILDKQNQLLKDSVDEFEHLLNSTIEAIYILEKGKCIDTNIEGIKLLGYENKSEVLGLDMLDVVTKEYHETLKENMKFNDVEPYEMNLTKKDGTIIPVLVRGKNFTLRNKKIRVSAMINLTQLKNNEKLLIEQSKMVALGEMLENIAHQWRQPLSVISTAASGVKIQKEHNLLNDEILDTSLDGIINNANYLSKTIDDFRNFILADKKKTRFNLKNHITNDLSILYSMTHINNIDIITDIREDINLNTIENELTQVIMNLLNNSKDQFIKEDIENRYIFIKGSIKDQKIILSIKDNAKGIDENIIDKIFEPYFTTKHKNVGTGLGLYMTQKIIHESLNGTIYVENVNYEYNNTKYKGAQFNIELPL